MQTLKQKGNSNISDILIGEIPRFVFIAHVE